MTSVQGEDWTNQLQAWDLIDNGDGTYTISRPGTGEGIAQLFGGLSAGAHNLVKRLVLGNWTRGRGRLSGAARLPNTQTSLTFDPNITDEAQLCVRVNQQRNARPQGSSS